MKLLLTGKIIHAAAPTVVGANNTKVQRLYLNVPGEKDEWTGYTANDETWEVSVLGEDNINRLKLDESWEGKNVTCKCYINSNTIPKTEQKPEMYIINARLAGIDVVK